MPIAIAIRDCDERKQNDALPAGSRRSRRSRQTQSRMDLQPNLLYGLIMMVFLSRSHVHLVCCDDNPLTAENPYYNSFITARMKQLTAIKNLQGMSNAVKRHKLIMDMLKPIFKVLEETRKLPALRDTVSVDLSHFNPHLQDVFQYMESTAFLCDFLVFFPEITTRLLKKNLLWRVMLIDSIQDAMNINVQFVDINTRSQFEKNSSPQLQESPGKPKKSGESHA
ncbi:uncharacterized protein LOC113214610 isoform X2 [Frankliniella occidentalis]|uniref:Uncharacterized protein LOC113214610 isoform X2 n=1 Tax=Frankliniella occidentalis TaxID=133901 RepID=A0A6J1TDQ6_FRAOC|nr:uncharacterized protein LOC113214610 isoform X2 [Frankliniella occidentalis]